MRRKAACERVHLKSPCKPVTTGLMNRRRYHRARSPSVFDPFLSLAVRHCVSSTPLEAAVQSSVCAIAPRQVIAWCASAVC